MDRVPSHVLMGTGAQILPNVKVWHILTFRDRNLGDLSVLNVQTVLLSTSLSHV